MRYFRNDLMWSQYSKNNTGFCIQIDVSKLAVNDPKFIMNVSPIIYGKKQPILFLDFFNTALDIENEKQNIFNLYEKAFCSMLPKKVQWSG